MTLGCSMRKTMTPMILHRTRPLAKSSCSALGPRAAVRHVEHRLPHQSSYMGCIGSLRVGMIMMAGHRREMRVILGDF